MSLPIDEVITPTTSAEVEQAILDLCVTAELPTTSWQSGAVIRTIISIVSEVIAAKSLIEIEIAKGGLGDLTSPEWAKIWAEAIYNIVFVSAEAATGNVDLTNTSATIYSLNPGDLIVANVDTGVTYRNQGSVTIPSSGSVSDVPIQADLVGIIGDAAPGEISVLVTSLVGVSVTNTLAVLGADEESTSSLVARTRAKLASLSPLGPKDAYNYVSETPLASFPPVLGTLLTSTSTPITRARTTADPDTGIINVFLATAEGAPSGADIVLVQLGLDRWAEPWCVSSTAQAAAELVIDITYRVWIHSSLTDVQIKQSIEIALITYFASVPVGGALIDSSGIGKIYVDKLAHVIHAAFANIEVVEIDLPVGDLTLTANQVPVLGTIVAVINFI